MKIMKNYNLESVKVGCVVVLFVMLVLALCGLSGCGTIHGICEDGKTAFTGLSNLTRNLAESESNTQRNWEEKSQLHQQKRAAYILEYQQKKDEAIAEAYNKTKASSDGWIIEDTTKKAEQNSN